MICYLIGDICNLNCSVLVIFKVFGCSISRNILCEMFCFIYLELNEKKTFIEDENNWCEKCGFS